MVSMRGQPALDGGGFAILFVVPVLWFDELGFQRQCPVVSWRDKSGAQHGVILFFLAVVALSGRAGRASEFLGGEIFGAIKRDQDMPIEASEAGERIRLGDGVCCLSTFTVRGGQAVERCSKQAEQFLRRHRIEHVPDVVIARDFFDGEQRLAIGAALPPFQRLLMGQKRRALREEHCKRRHDNIRHVILHILPPTLVGQCRAATVQNAYEPIENHI